MTTFEEIYNMLKNYSISELHTRYNNRQEKVKFINNQIAKSILTELDCLNDKDSEHYSMNLIFFIAIVLKSRNYNEIKRLMAILKEKHYNDTQNILLIASFLDSFLSRTLNPQDFFTVSNGMIGISQILPINATEHKLITKFGDFTIKRADKSLNMSPIHPSLRKHLCHNVTTNFLLTHPQFYGAYCYIPEQFSGYIEHSVVVNPENNTVYDLANNFTIDFDLWKKLYPISFMISGYELLYLYDKINEKLGIPIGMEFIEEAKRIREKK